MTRTVDLAEFARETGQADPIEYQRRANQWLGSLRARVAPLSLEGTSLDALDALRGALNIEIGRTLSNLALCRALAARYGQQDLVLSAPENTQAIASVARYVPGAPRLAEEPRTARLTRRARAIAWVARRDMQQQLAAVRRPRTAEWGNAPALVVTRVKEHLPHVLPIAVELRRSHGIASVFAVSEVSTKRDVETAGFRAVHLNAHAPPNPISLLASAGSLVARVAAAIKSLRPAGFEPLELQALGPVAITVVAQNAGELIRVAGGIGRFVAEARPAFVLVANPYTMDGRVSWRVAAARGIPTAAIEHGTVFANDPIWDECSVDLLCAWGEPSRKSLIACGVRDEQIAIVGAAYLDAQLAAFEREPSDPPIILVATSGPGDQVSHEQHGAFVEMLFEAAVECPEIRFVVKLHRKDRAEIYAASAARHPGGQVEVVSGPMGDVFRRLRGAKAMITVASTAALEALAVNVPVITVKVWASKATLVDFIDRGCTHSVADAPSLAKKVRAALMGTLDPTVETRARAYAGEQFANLGRAAPAAAARLAKLAGQRR